MNSSIVFRNFFHTGYVVRNADKVMHSMKEKFGVANWKVLRLDEG
jgi:hypothetical protein